jgi:hypothetical protein
LPVSCAVSRGRLGAARHAGVVRTGNISPIIESLDRSLAFYEDLLHLQVPPNRGGGPRPFFQNPASTRCSARPGATERHVDARIPGTSMGIEMIEFHDVDRRGARPRVQDPGQVVIVLLVRERRRAARAPDGRGVSGAHAGRQGRCRARRRARRCSSTIRTGRPVELRQLASLPPSAPADGEIVGGRLAITVADLDKTVASIARRSAST